MKAALLYMDVLYWDSDVLYWDSELAVLTIRDQGMW